MRLYTNNMDQMYATWDTYIRVKHAEYPNLACPRPTDIFVSTHNTGTVSTSALGVCRCTVLSLARMDGCVRDDDDRDDDGHGTW